VADEKELAKDLREPSPELKKKQNRVQEEQTLLTTQI
jgi:hypothetical protein